MAFGTSVAGVAASAMLGFIATLSRRERIAVSRELDQQRDSRFRDYSLSHQRQQTYSALQQQADALPAVASQLTALSERLGTMGEQLSQQLVDNQQQFQQRVQDDFQALASSVAESLNRSLADSGRQAGETIKPVVEGLLAGLERDLQQRHQQFDDAAQARLEAMSSQLEHSAATINTAWQKGLESQQSANRELADAVGQGLSRSAQIVRRVNGLRELARFWSPFCRVRRLLALIPEVGSRVTGPAEVADGLRAKWEPFFGDRHEGYQEDIAQS